MAKKTDISDADLLLLDIAMKGVVPLPGRKNKKIENQVPKEKIAIKCSPNANRRAAPPVKISDQPALAHGDTPGLDKRSAQRLKRGKMPIEARLDLHGHSQDKAYRDFNGFITDAANAGKRCVLVITGSKRDDTGEPQGVLRKMVPRWLNEEPNLSRILKSVYAIRRDGGEGALYVLLKRKRAEDWS